MVVVLFAERHENDVVWLADEIARAFARGSPERPVALAHDGHGASRSDVEAVARVDTTQLGAREVFDTIRTLADGGATVVAVSSGRTDRALATFDAADRILLVSDLTVSSIRSLQRTIKLCDSLGISRQRTPVVLYDCRDDGGVLPGEAASVLPRQVFAFLSPGPDGPADRAGCDAIVAQLLRGA